MNLPTAAAEGPSAQFGPTPTSGGASKRILYVSGLPPVGGPYPVSAEVVHSIFVPFGPIRNVKLRPGQAGARGKLRVTYGFVEFEEISDARHALANVHRGEYGGRTLNVCYAKKTQMEKVLPVDVDAAEAEAEEAEGAEKEGEGSEDGTEVPMPSGPEAGGYVAGGADDDDEDEDGDAVMVEGGGDDDPHEDSGEEEEDEPPPRKLRKIGDD